MNYEDYEIAGYVNASKRRSGDSYSDEDLNKQIFVLERVVKYLNGRGDCDLVVKSLRLELYSLEEYQKNRKLNKK